MRVLSFRQRQGRLPTVICCVVFLFCSGFLFAQSNDIGTVFFVQVSDTHWGFNNPRINPDYSGTLAKGVAEINAIQGFPDFLIFTGDETHTTNDPAIRRQRMAEFKSITSALKIRDVKYVPGEHDAGLDNAQAYREFFGEPHYTFDVKGVHFVVLDNVSTPDGSLGEAQLQWLQGVLNTFDKDSLVVVFAHRPLIDVYAKWDWRTKDGAEALALLKPFKNVHLFYGHIHQERQDSEGGFTQQAAQGMMFPLPAPGSVASPNPVPWNPAHPYQGLGFRTVRIDLASDQFTVHEYGISADESLTASN